MSAEIIVGSVDTLDELKTKNRKAFTVGGKGLVAVRGRGIVGDWGAVRLARYSETFVGTADDIQISDAADGGQWVFDDARKGFIDARWAGVVGDGITDDSAAFGACASLIEARGSGILYVPPGAYRVTGGTPGRVICHLHNLTRFELRAHGAKFVSDEFSADWSACSLTISGAVVTVTVPGGHGIPVGTVGKYIGIKDVSGEQGYRGTWITTGTPSSTTVTFSQFSYFEARPTAPATGSFHVSHIGNVLFRFSNCQNVSLGDLCFEGYAQPRDIQYRLGWIVLQTVNNTSGIDGHLRVSGAAYGLWCGDFDTHNGDGCDGYRLKIDAVNSGYPISLNGGGGHSTYDIVGHELHRGAYVSGVDSVGLRLAVRDWDVAGVIVTHQLYGGTETNGCSNIDIDLQDTGSSGHPVLNGVGSTRYMVVLSDYPVAYPSGHRGVRIRLRGKDVPYTVPFSAQLSNTVHRIDGLTLTGYIDNSGLDPATELRQDFYVDLTGSSAGGVSGWAIRDYTCVQPASGTGAFNARLFIEGLEDDVVIDNYQSDQPRNFSFPVGRSVATVPAFPEFDHPSAESFAQGSHPGGLGLASAAAVLTSSASIGTGSFTAIWSGSVPPVGTNAAMFSLTPTVPGIAGTGLEISAETSDLVIRLYGATLTDYREARITHWQHAHGGRVVSVGIVRPFGGSLRIFVDGHEAAFSEDTSGSPPAWSDTVGSYYAYVGRGALVTSYSGRVHRFAVWSYDRSAEFPELALCSGGSGIVGQAGSSPVMDSVTNNGSFESGLSGWTISAFGSAVATTSADAEDGAISADLIAGPANDFVSISQSVMEVGAAYTVRMWVKVLGADYGAVSIVGGSQGEFIAFSVPTEWTEITYSDVWTDTAITVKRADGADRHLLIDNIRIEKVGAYFDLDWTAGFEDRVTGAVPGFSGITSVRSGIRCTGEPPSVNHGDTNFTVYAGRDYPTHLFNTALTVSRTFTMELPGARRGDRFKVIRNGAGAGDLSVVSGVTEIAKVDVNQWLESVFDGSAWIVASRGWMTRTITPSSIVGSWPSGLSLAYATPATPAASTGALYVPAYKSFNVKWPDASTSQVLLDTFTGPITGSTAGTTTDVLIQAATASPPPTTAYHLQIRIDGFEHGPGNTVRDTKMLRTGVGTYTFTSNIVVPGTITLGGSDLQTTLNTKVASTRSISTQHSLTGGGDLSANRTLNLVNDTASPGIARFYGTDSAGTRGWQGTWNPGASFTYANPGTPASSVGTLYVLGLRTVKFKWPDASTSQVLLDAFTGPITGTTTGDTTDILLRGATASPPPSTTYHMVLRMDGVEHGPGNTARDTKMLRTGVGTYTFTSNIVVPGTITLGGSDLQTTLNTKVASTRSISTQHSLTGGGDLSANRTLNLVNDTASPGNNKLYGTDGSGTRGWYSQPSSSSNTVAATTNAVTVPNSSTTEDTLVGSLRAGESLTFGANTLTSGTVIKVEIAGLFSAAGDWSGGILRFKIGTSLVAAITLAEIDSTTPSSWAWNGTAFLTVTTAGASATTVLTAWADFEYRDPSNGVAPFPMRFRGAVSGTLNTTASNVLDVTFQNNAGQTMDFSARHILVTRY